MKQRRPSSLAGCALTAGAAALVLSALLALTAFLTYGVDTTYDDREDVWPERGRELIPYAAKDITLQRDLLDHYASYTISERDLEAFLDVHFDFHSEPVDSRGERSPVDPRLVGTAIGRLNWIVEKGTVVYSYAARNGGVSTYYHHPPTGRTYQSSAYW